MRHQKLRPGLSFNTVCLLLIATTVFWNEYLSYTLCSLWWHREFPQTRSLSESVVLFVADPQLQGYHDSYLSVSSLASLAILDADRYLEHGFSRALSHVQPDAVVFLGDLLDEGSQAEDADFTSYSQRFHHIFHTPDNVQRIFIPGDNDVGGETFSDPREDWKVQRFRAAFPSQPVTSVLNTDFVHLDVAYDEDYTPARERQLRTLGLNLRSTADAARLALNHMTVLTTINILAVELIGAQGIISAHTHSATLINCTTRMREFTRGGVIRKLCDFSRSTWTDGRVLELPLGQAEEGRVLWEAVVPTCSYRMGVPDMGYAAAYIDTTLGKLKLTVLWLPSRYPQLLLYGLVLPPCIIALVVNWLRRRLCP